MKKLSGLTIIELIVVISIISVLMSLVLVGVQAIRSSARSTYCMNNLRQLGIAFSNYHDSCGVFPETEYPFRSLLPYLEASQLAKGLPVYGCPADGELQPQLGEVSYVLNQGYAYQVFGANGIIREIASERKPHSFSDIADGLSNTACMSEKLRDQIPYTNARARQQPLRSYWLIGRTNIAPNLTAVARLLESCKNDRSNATPHRHFGSNGALLQCMGYNHMLGPNNASCHQETAELNRVLEPMESVLPPSSLHGDFVHLIMLDTSVHTVSNAIDLPVWHAIGTRSGGESHALPVN